MLYNLKPLQTVFKRLFPAFKRPKAAKQQKTIKTNKNQQLQIKTLVPRAQQVGLCRFM